MNLCNNFFMSLAEVVLLNIVAAPPSVLRGRTLVQFIFY